MTREELLKAIITELQKGKIKDFNEHVQEALREQIPATVLLNDAFLVAMQNVADKWSQGKAFIPEVLIAARCLNSGLDLIGPELLKHNVETKGIIVLGTVKTDLHDIGKNLVGLMLKSKGFEVIDLGIDVAPEKFVEAVKTYQPDYVCMSALLTTSMPSMKQTVEALIAAGLRDSVKICVGGAPVTLAYCQQIGADIYEPDAITLAQRLLDLSS